MRLRGGRRKVATNRRRQNPVVDTESDAMRGAQRKEETMLTEQERRVSAFVKEQDERQQWKEEAARDGREEEERQKHVFTTNTLDPALREVKRILEQHGRKVAITRHQPGMNAGSSIVVRHGRQPELEYDVWFHSTQGIIAVDGTLKLWKHDAIHPSAAEPAVGPSQGIDASVEDFVAFVCSRWMDAARVP
jgi:hypothetical protein